MRDIIHVHSLSIEILDEDVVVSEKVLCKISVKSDGIIIPSMNVCYYDKIVIFPPKGVEIDKWIKSQICEKLTEVFSDYILNSHKISEARVFTFPVDLYINHPDKKDEYLCRYFKSKGVDVLSVDSEYITLKTSNSSDSKLSLSLMYAKACEYMLQEYAEKQQ